MEQLDNVVKEIQTQAILLFYIDQRTQKGYASEKVNGYIETIKIINKVFQTNYRSRDLEKIAGEAKKHEDCILGSPLFSN